MKNETILLLSGTAKTQQRNIYSEVHTFASTWFVDLLKGLLTNGTPAPSMHLSGPEVSAPKSHDSLWLRRFSPHPAKSRDFEAPRCGMSSRPKFLANGDFHCD